MSTSVASGSSLKAHNSRRGHVGDRAESRSISPDIDDQDSVINLEDELQQQLENEMSASYDDDDSDSKSATGRSATAELAAVDQSDNESVAGDGDSSSSDNDSDDDDDEIDAALFGGGGAQDSNDEEIDLDFVDPPTAEESKSAQPASDDEDDSASDDEFETVEVSAGALQPPPRFDAPILSTAETGLKRKRQNPFYIGDRHIVERYKDEKPSMTVHMFDSHYRFEDQEGVFLYNESTRFFFDALNEGRIPVELVDVLSEFNSCRYYEGCLIVE
ncbi:Transcription factor spt20, partial [Coemansia sp. S100]